MKVYVVIEHNSDGATWASATMVAIFHKEKDAEKERARLEKKHKLVFTVEEWEVL